MKEITVSKRNLIVALILGGIIAVGILGIQNWPHHSSIPSEGEDSLASAAAVTALKKVFHIHYQEGKEAWLSRICKVSTPAGCELFTAGADRMWEKYSDAKSVVTAAAQAVEKMADNGSEQVWKMAITLSAPLPGSNKTQDTAYVVLVKMDTGWKMDRFLMEAESRAILSRSKTPTPTVEEGKKP